MFDYAKGFIFIHVQKPFQNPRNEDFEMVLDMKNTHSMG
jgi:hypothetical protein